MISRPKWKTRVLFLPLFFPLLTTTNSLVCIFSSRYYFQCMYEKVYRSVLCSLIFLTNRIILYIVFMMLRYFSPVRYWQIYIVFILIVMCYFTEMWVSQNLSNHIQTLGLLSYFQLFMIIGNSIMDLLYKHVYVLP